MKRSTDRILTTHAGSLPRPDDLRAMVAAKSGGQAYDDEALATRLTELHSYELPELLVVPVAWGTDGYLEWVNASTRT